ncbi:MAG: 30S ribosomal protein S20 [Chloroflexi bacterium]|nr:30S ribosomal protein S20 [Chloroflexota bacterium]
MANTKSALKQWRVSLRKRARTRPVRSETRTLVARAVALIAAGDRGAAEAAVRAASSSLDKAAGKRVLHANNAARHKSRLMKRLSTAFIVVPAAPAATPKAPPTPRRRAASGSATSRAPRRAASQERA